ncbi:CIC11C00000003052 [Sungouiella intermedia]|uniref:CIC11C00000003052 n=1 Tax=Sungouiella intermedia TaxID=45354 RepID=A0A1L0GAL1_9ASCO|nr:CIC11C00000003052 [[Candida] intermedia]
MDYLCNHRPVSVAAEIAVLERCHPRQSSHHSTRHPPYQVRNASGKVDYEPAVLVFPGNYVEIGWRANTAL